MIHNKNGQVASITCVLYLNYILIFQMHLPVSDLVNSLADKLRESTESQACTESMYVKKVFSGLLTTKKCMHLYKDM